MEPISQQEKQVIALNCDYFLSDADPLPILRILPPFKESRQRVRFPSRDAAEIVAAKLLIAGYEKATVVSRYFTNQQTHTVIYS